VPIAITQGVSLIRPIEQVSCAPKHQALATRRKNNQKQEAINLSVSDAALVLQTKKRLGEKLLQPFF